MLLKLTNGQKTALHALFAVFVGLCVTYTIISLMNSWFGVIDIPDFSYSDFKSVTVAYNQAFLSLLRFLVSLIVGVQVSRVYLQSLEVD